MQWKIPEILPFNIYTKIKINKSQDRCPKFLKGHFSTKIFTVYCSNKNVASSIIEDFWDTLFCTKSTKYLIFLIVFIFLDYSS